MVELYFVSLCVCDVDVIIGVGNFEIDEKWMNF